MLCWTRKPSKARTLPSSIVVGIETETDFLHSCSTATSRSSMPNVSATRRSCARAIWNGFSLRWLSGASVAIAAPSSLDPAASIGGYSTVNISDFTEGFPGSVGQATRRSL